MCRRNVRRTIAALVAVVALMLAGAAPASAVELGLLNGLTRAWSAVAAEPGLWDRLTAWFGGAEKALPLGEDPATANV